MLYVTFFGQVGAGNVIHFCMNQPIDCFSLMKIGISLGAECTIPAKTEILALRFTMY